MKDYQNSSGLALKFYKDNWVAIDLKELLPKRNSVPSEAFSFASYNVLMNNMRKRLRITELLFQSEKRFQYQCCTLFKNINTDFFALCEVTDQFLNVLFKTDFIREYYFVSPIIEEAYHKKHGVLLLSKYPFWTFSFNDICGYGRVQAALFILAENKAFIAVGLHLSAYEENSHVRKYEFKKFLKGLSELEKLCEVKELIPYIKLAISQNNIVIMGDLNFHLPIETNILLENNFSDLWLETEEIRTSLQRRMHPLGFTWDPTKNKFINYWLPFDNRRMRLDRIAIKDVNSLFEVKSPVEIFANEPINPKSRSYMQGGSVKLCPPGSFLYPSDHYGLKVALGIKETPLQRKERRSTPLDNKDNNLYATGYRRMSDIKSLRKKVFVNGGLGFLLVFLWLSGFLWKLITAS